MTANNESYWPHAAALKQLTDTRCIEIGTRVAMLLKIPEKMRQAAMLGKYSVQVSTPRDEKVITEAEAEATANMLTSLGYKADVIYSDYSFAPFINISWGSDLGK